MFLSECDDNYLGSVLLVSGGVVRSLLFYPGAYFDYTFHRVADVARMSLPAYRRMRAVYHSQHATHIEKAVAYDEYRQHRRELRQKHNIRYSRLVLSMSALPAAVLSIWYVRDSLCGLDTHITFLWAPSVTRPDPSYILPLIAEALFSLQANLSVHMLCKRDPASFQRFVMPVRIASVMLPIASLPLLTEVPAGVFVYCIGMGLVGLFQPLVVRRWLLR